MEIKLSKNKLCLNQIIAQRTEKIVVEGDEIVPDVKPDVLSIVSANGNICIYKKEIIEGGTASSSKIKLDGCVCVYITYIADDEKSSLRALNTTIDFSKTIEMKDVKTNMQIECNTSLDSIDCKILNGRKINIRANMLFEISACSYQNIEYIGNFKKVYLQLIIVNF